MDEENLTDEVVEQDDVVTDEVAQDEELEGQTESQEDATEEASEPEVSEPSFSEESLQLAEMFGLDPQDFGSEQALKRAASALDRKMVSLFREQQTQPTQKVEEKPAPKAEDAAEELDLDELLPESEFEPRVRKVFAHVLKQNQELKKQLDGIREPLSKVETLDQFVQRQESQRVHSELDTLFGGAGEEWKEVFGEGPMTGFKPDSAEAKARNELIDEMMAIQAGDAHFGRPASDMKTLFKRALASKYYDKQEKIARRQVAKQLTARKGTSVAKASVKKGLPVDGEARAAQRAIEYYKQAGAM